MPREEEPTTRLPTPLGTTLARRFDPVPHSYTERDASLYALAVGAAAADGAPPSSSSPSSPSPSSSPSNSNPSELALVYDGAAGFAPLPTFPCTFPYFGVTAAVPFEEILPNFNPMGVLHGEQFVSIPRPLPPAAEVETEPRVLSVSDKGKAAVVVLSATTRDRSRHRKRPVLCYQELTVFVRGAGGFGGEGGVDERQAPSTSSSPPRPAAATAANAPPSRPPDDAFEQRLPRNAAALYRLTGDENPLHVDPEFAAMAGFARPILHGLCTLAFGVRAVINSTRAGASGDASLVRTVKGRMSSHVFPGETLRTEMWLLRPEEADAPCCSCSLCSSGSPPPPSKRKKNYRKVVFVTSVVERGTRAITGAAVELGDPEREEEEEGEGDGEGARSRL